MTPVSGLANNTTFGPAFRAITMGMDHLNNSLAEIFWPLQLLKFRR